MQDESIDTEHECDEECPVSRHCQKVARYEGQPQYQCGKHTEADEARLIKVVRQLASLEGKSCTHYKEGEVVDHGGDERSIWEATDEVNLTWTAGHLVWVG